MVLGCRPSDAARARTGGFTLVEILVALGIVVVLVALTTSAAVAAVRRAETNRTENTLKLLELAVETWEHSSDRKLTWGDDKDTYDVWDKRAFPLIVSEVLEVVMRHPDAKSIVAKIDPDSLYTYVEGEYPAWVQPHDMMEKDEFNGTPTVLDAWGTPIYSTHPGALWSSPGVRDDDGTNRTLNERWFGIARNRRICFVSAGPDRLFGLQDEGLPGYAEILDARRDNVYSYQPLFIHH